MGSIVSGIGQQQQDNFQQSVNAYNTRLAQSQAGDAEARGALAAGNVRMQGSQLLGKQQTAYAASGVDSTTGSPLQHMMDTRVMTELDARTVENNALREAFGFKTQALEGDAQQKMLQQKQKNDAFSTFLTGSAQLVSMGAGASPYLAGPKTSAPNGPTGPIVDV
jgi:hypothetical protein